QVKFPANLRLAPYSIVAAGVQLLPQKVEFPFALINLPSARFPDIAPAYNEIEPGWVLAHNAYMLKRNEQKYRARNQARRTAIAVEVFHPGTVRLMRAACQRLESAIPRNIYTESEIPGLGKNYLRETSRQAAITAYRLALRHYALLGLKEAVQAALAQGRRDDIVWLLSRPSPCPRWELQRQILSEDPGITDVTQALRELLPMLDQAARDVEASKGRDDQRG